jgi:hypothetical protein
MIVFDVKLAFPPSNRAFAQKTPRPFHPSRPFASCLTRFLLSQSKKLAFPRLCFQSLTNAFSRNSRLFNSFQMPGVFFCSPLNYKIKDQ